MNRINYKRSMKKQLLSMAMLLAMSLSVSAQQLFLKVFPKKVCDFRNNG